VGAHSLAAGVRADLAGHGVRLVDLAAGAPGPPAMSTIMVTRGSGDRAVVSVNAAGRSLSPPAGLAALVEASQAVHLDGHHPALALAAARLARERGRLTLLDGGSWKPGTAELLPYIDVAVASADFRPPGTRTPEEVLAHLRAAGVPWAAVSRGPEPVLWRAPGEGDRVRSCPVPPVEVVDTLGAGDILHGALAFALCRALAAQDAAPGRSFERDTVAGQADRLTPDGFAAALAFAVAVASASCASFGTRAWTQAGPAAVAPS
jgi:sugar/nucleoside kinase (ribokinase family)